MAMNGIDISHWQSAIDLEKVRCDFVIIKMTEGISHLDSKAEEFYSKARKLGKKIGFYHFAHPEYNNVFDEAKFFYRSAKTMFNHGIPILDWESVGRWDVGWAKTWLDEIHKLSGVKPMIYMSESTVLENDWSEVADADYGLWVAKYNDTNVHYNYDMSDAGRKPTIRHWPVMAMWQWTSNGRLTGYSDALDCDIFYGDASAWDRYAGTRSIEEIANEVIAGKWSNGFMRAAKLKLAGYDYQAVRETVNESFRSRR